MFSAAVKSVREGVYGVQGLSKVASNQVSVTTGTGFMVSPGYILTVAHLTHIENKFQKPLHTDFEVIRAPDIGQSIEKAKLVAEDQERDVALLKIVGTPRSKARLVLHPNVLPVGTNCGSIGFPLSTVAVVQNKRMFKLTERFQGAYISAFYSQTTDSGRTLAFYETDSLMYKGSSGSPGFAADGRVFGIHVKTAVEKKKDADGSVLRERGRLAIAMWIPSAEIIQFCKKNGISLASK